MKTQSQNTLEFLYQETELHFLVNPTDKNVMINATEMAKIFDKRVDVFMKTDNTKAFIYALELTGKSVSLKSNQPPNGGRIIDNRGRNGIYFNEILALKFASWLDPNFEIWIYRTIRDLLTKETKIVKNSISEIKTAEQKLTEAIAKAKLEGNKEALTIIDALENRDLAKKNKDKAMRIFTNQMKMQL